MSRYSGPEWERRLAVGREIADRTVREQEAAAPRCAGCGEPVDAKAKRRGGKRYCEKCKDWGDGPEETT